MGAQIACACFSAGLRDGSFSLPTAVITDVDQHCALQQPVKWHNPQSCSPANAFYYLWYMTELCAVRGIRVFGLYPQREGLLQLGLAAPNGYALQVTLLTFCEVD